MLRRALFRFGARLGESALGVSALLVYHRDRGRKLSLARPEPIPLARERCDLAVERLERSLRDLGTAGVGELRPQARAGCLARGRFAHGGLPTQVRALPLGLSGTESFIG